MIIKEPVQICLFNQCPNSYILMIKANEMHNFSNLFDKVRYMFGTGPLSIIRSIFNTVYMQ